MKKTTNTTKTKTATPPQAGNLAGWMKGASPRVKALLTRTLSRGEKSSRALFVFRRRALELRGGPDGWNVHDAKTGDLVPFVASAALAPKAPRKPKEATVRQAKAAGLRDLDRKYKKEARDKERKERADKKGEVRATIKATKKARSARLKATSKACKSAAAKARATTKGTARRVAVATSRVRCAQTKVSVEQGFAKRLQKLEQQVADLRPARAPKRRTSTARPKQRISAREQRAQVDQAVKDELERRGLAHLIPVWEQMKGAAARAGLATRAAGARLADLPFDRAIEKFLEAVTEDDGAIEQEQQRQELVGEQLAAQTACDEAAEYARGGDDQAELWARENCPGGRPLVRVTSAQDRTLSMFGGIRPPRDNGKRSKSKRGTRKPPAATRGQQTMGVGRFGASFVDTPGRQATF